MTVPSFFFFSSKNVDDLRIHERGLVETGICDGVGPIQRAADPSSSAPLLVFVDIFKPIFGMSRPMLTVFATPAASYSALHCHICNIALWVYTYSSCSPPCDCSVPLLRCCFFLLFIFFSLCFFLLCLSFVVSLSRQVWRYCRCVCRLPLGNIDSTCIQLSDSPDTVTTASSRFIILLCLFGNNQYEPSIWFGRKGISIISVNSGWGHVSRPAFAILI